ncbi:hypothetical protein SAMN05444274_101611 [Mariniphaga anaerophila]|uniref:4-O-methyl-glucuronoyl methylesterase-like domain-containing protein n=1 Tax=Mariniphaga anaerophila TaxID=1484053 RepID=A0A1M4U958_9BACT|nr:hypothetical protein [Mariniphaga anaerophila]SHE53110.1 hypothetical protein SAMN05444274_101611 [Mariniphaga anaerophila]
MQIIRQIFILSIISILAQSNSVAQDKEWENNVIYNEKQVPFYELPDPLVTVEGKRVATVDDWEQIRRPQIMGMFASTIYGKVPQPEKEIEQEFELLDTDEKFLDGKCTRKRLLFNFSNHRGSVGMHMVVYLPNHVNGPVPVLLQISFSGADRGSIETDNIQSYGRLRNGIPLIHFLNQGFGVAYINGGEAVRDGNSFGGNTIHKLFYKGNQSLPRADEWGVIGGIAWQASRAMDYLETDNDVDHSKVALLGFSKLGKCALWAAAQDTRFAMALSQNSGCAGAALWRRSFGENLKYMFRFPHWLCGNARKYIGNEGDLPVDQHMLLACIAPRPVYVTSGLSDNWADPMGEYLSSHHATPVYELYGLKGQPTKERPRINEPAEDRALSYVIRSGGHGYFYKDWDRYIKFMKFHFNKK